MNIVQFNTVDSGGAFQAANRLQNGLIQSSISSKMLVLYKKKEQYQPNIISYLENQSIFEQIKHTMRFRFIQRKIDAQLKNKPNCQYRFPNCPFKIQEHKLVNQADIVHLHWMAKFLDYPTFFKSINKPVVWTLHDTNPFNGGFNYDCYALPEYDELEKEVRTIKLKSIKQAKDVHIISISKWIHQLSSNSEIFGHLPHHYIPNGLDVNLFKPQNKQEARDKLQLPQDKKIILFVAESIDDKRKGFSYLEDALVELNVDEVFLLTVGKSLNTSIPFPLKNLGFVNDEIEMATVYAAADVFVVTSIEDNLPNTVMESIACGTPVVGFKVGGIPDMIQDGVNGFLVEKGDSIKLAQKINELLNHSDLQNQMQTHARQIAVQNFNQELQVKRHVELYREIISIHK